MLSCYMLGIQSLLGVVLGLTRQWSGLKSSVDFRFPSDPGPGADHDNILVWIIAIDIDLSRVSNHRFGMTFQRPKQMHLLLFYFYSYFLYTDTSVYIMELVWYSIYVLDLLLSFEVLWNLFWAFCLFPSF